MSALATKTHRTTLTLTLALTLTLTSINVTRKNRQVSIKIAQKYLTRKMIDFDTLTKIA